jgi:hypothetical protein
MEDEIFKISKNKIMAKSLYEMAKERLMDIDSKAKTYKIVEDYYEIIKELITALMYHNGFKTLSHKMLITYLKENYKEFQEFEIISMDNLRKLRNNIVYYGQRVDKEFLINNEKELINIINKLFRILTLKLNDESE